MRRWVMLATSGLVATALYLWVRTDPGVNLLDREADLRGVCHVRIGLGRAVEYSAHDAAQWASYDQCMRDEAKLFTSVDYAEVKDLSKAFFTLLTAVLVGSITFSEKIVDINSATRRARTLMVWCWSLLLVAITTCGVGLVLMTVALGYATYSPHLDYWSLERKAIILYVVAGVSFGAGLATMIAAGVDSMRGRQTKGRAPTP